MYAIRSYYVLDLKANPNKRAVGTVIESSLDKGRGFVTTILVQSGTMKVGDMILSGAHYGVITSYSIHYTKLYDIEMADIINALH